jgi:16S rRNA (cytidine1402-2'-O)-methyltransferase
MANSKTSAGNLPIVHDAPELNVLDRTELNDTDASCKPPERTDFKQLAPGLYLVATPIGNAADITLRALDILSRADIVLCEDTRISGKLMKTHDIQASMQSYHEHNAERVRPMIMKHLGQGKVVAMISDAGMPLVSDPGYKMVKACVNEGVMVTAAPGPSATLTALVISGLPTDRFFFQGFLPPKAGARQKSLSEISTIPGTLIFLESTKRLAASLADMSNVLGNRPAAVGRELTKFYEEIRRGNLDELATYYAYAGAPKGEITLCVGPPLAISPPSEDTLDVMLKKALISHSVKEVAAHFAITTGLSKRVLYNRALVLKGECLGSNIKR